jgi:hypothetical protein
LLLQLQILSLFFSDCGNFTLTRFFASHDSLEADRVAQKKLLGEIAGLLFKNSKVLT